MAPVSGTSVMGIMIVDNQRRAGEQCARRTRRYGRQSSNAASVPGHYRFIMACSEAQLPTVSRQDEIGPVRLVSLCARGPPTQC